MHGTSVFSTRSTRWRPSSSWSSWGRGRVSSARWHGDGDDEVTSAGLRLSTMTIWARCVTVHGGTAHVCYLLSMHWFSLEEERVMQQSSVSISLSFWEPMYQSSRRLHASRLIPAQTNKNLATNARKGLSIPSRPLAKVRSDKDNKINIFGIFVV